MQENWQKTLADCITSLDELCDILALNKQQLVNAQPAIDQFPLQVPRRFVAKMRKGDLNDPLLRQILPLPDEALIFPSYHPDPLDEKNATPVPGLLHKYHGRVLWVLSGGCAINCRYCFRRHFPYSTHLLNQSNWEKPLAYISQNTSIEEVILSGGDPLLIKDTPFAELIKRLETIPHLNTLRIHTRIPIVLPERITTDFLQLLQSSRFHKVIVVHCNHADELDHDVKAKLLLLKKHDITLLNQAVLLKGVNDQLDALKDLSKTLFSCGVQPYYLHQLDKVQGAQHFEVDQRKAKRLYADLQNNLPGYLVPKFVFEKPGAKAKTSVF